MAENSSNSEQQARVSRYIDEIRQEKYQALRTVRERFLRLHNRFPSKEEEQLYIKKTIGDDWRVEEPPLEASHPEDFLPIFTAYKGVEVLTKGAYRRAKSALSKTSEAMINTGGTSTSASRREFIKNTGIVTTTGAAALASPKLIRRLAGTGKKDAVRASAGTGSRVLPKEIASLMARAERDPKFVKELENQYKLNLHHKKLGLDEGKTFYKTPDSKGAEKVNMEEFFKHWNKRNPSKAVTPLSKETVGGVALAGWIGSKKSLAKEFTAKAYNNMQKAERLKKANIPDERIFKETGWFELVPGQKRFLDLDFVDDFAKHGDVGKRVEVGLNKSIMMSKSYKKHGATPPIIRELDETSPQMALKPEGWRGSYWPTKNMMDVKKGGVVNDPAQVKSHEMQHGIQNKQGLPSGANASDIAQEYNLDLPVARDIYRHSYGEVEARVTQYYHRIAKQLLKAGKSPEEVKKTLAKIPPQKILKSREPDLNLDKIWTDIRTVNPQEYAK